MHATRTQGHLYSYWSSESRHAGSAVTTGVQRRNLCEHARHEGRPMVQVLVAEDVGAISIALEDALTDAGYKVAGPFASGAAATEWLHGNQPDLALLDAVLSDGLCIELARALRARAVPFLFLSGNAPLYGMPPDLNDAPWIEKPITYDQLVDALSILSARSS